MHAYGGRSVSALVKAPAGEAVIPGSNETYVCCEARRFSIRAVLEPHAESLSVQDSQGERIKVPTQETESAK